MKTYSLKDKRIILALSPLSLLVTFGIPGLNIIVPWILWLSWKNQNPEILQLGKKILNTQISYTVYMVSAYSLSTFHDFQWMITIFILAWLAMVYYTVLNIMRLTISEADYRDPGAISIFK